MNNLLLYVVYHDDKSFKICYEQLYKYSWIQFIKIETTKYCESIFFDYLLEHYETWKSYDFVGMITYSFATKIELSILLDAYKNITEGKFNDFDIIGLRRLKYGIGDQSQIGIGKHLVELMNKVHYMLNKEVFEGRHEIQKVTSREVKTHSTTYSNKKDRRVSVLASVNVSPRSHGIDNDASNLQLIPRTYQHKNLYDMIDWNSHMNKVVPFYSNYWIAKSDILKPFLKWAKLVKDLIDTDPILAEENSHYKVDSKDFIPIFGRPYMTWHPFIMERMICIYAYLSKAHIHTYETAIKVRNNKKVFGTGSNLSRSTT